MGELVDSQLCRERHKHLCDEITELDREARLINADKESRLRRVEDAVLILTKLAETEKLWKFVVIGLTLVIVVIVLGPEIASTIAKVMIG